MIKEKAMNKHAILFGALIISACGGLGATAHDETAKGSSKTAAHLGTVNGVISDSRCTFDHNTGNKDGHKTDAVLCTKKCVSEGRKLVLADKKNNIVYTISNSKLAEEFAGKSVAVTGQIDPQTKVIEIKQIKAQ
jgi:hypothetical protein